MSGGYLEMDDSEARKTPGEQNDDDRGAVPTQLGSEAGQGTAPDGVTTTDDGGFAPSLSAEREAATQVAKDSGCLRHPSDRGPDSQPASSVS
jgi:hypothetical protein